MAGVAEADVVAVSHDESDVTVKGTAFPLPSAFTCNDCDAGFWAAPPTPEKVRLLGASDSTELLVTTSVTGIVVIAVLADVLMVTVVM